LLGHCIGNSAAPLRRCQRSDRWRETGCNCGHPVLVRAYRRWRSIGSRPVVIAAPRPVREVRRPRSRGGRREKGKQMRIMGGHQQRLRWVETVSGGAPGQWLLRQCARLCLDRASRSAPISSRLPIGRVRCQIDRRQQIGYPGFVSSGSSARMRRQLLHHSALRAAQILDDESQFFEGEFRCPQPEKCVSIEFCRVT